MSALERQPALRHLLNTVKKHPGSNLSQLAELTGRNTGNLSRDVAALVRLGLARAEYQLARRGRQRRVWAI